MAFIVSAFLTSNTMQPRQRLWENAEKQKGKDMGPNVTTKGILCGPSGL